MRKFEKYFLCTLFVSTLTTFSFADDTDPKVIIDKTIVAYKTMDTYKSIGSIVSEIDMGDGKITTKVLEFSILLKKPDLYKITWQEKADSDPSNSHTSAHWSDGESSHRTHIVSVEALNLYDYTNGISRGDAHTIPSLFLESSPDLRPNPFSRLMNTKLEATEQIQGEDCYVIKGRSDESKQEAYWISKSEYLIRKYSRDLEPPEDGNILPGFTNEDFAERTAGDTAATKKQLHKTMIQSRLKGTSTEIHSQVTSPKLSQKDFQFEIPQENVAKDSLLTK